MAKGFAVISGSSTVVAKILDNGVAVFGQGIPINMRISGTLVLDLSGSSAGDGKYLRSDASGSAKWATITAAEVSASVNGFSGSNVQSLLEETKAAIGDLQSSQNLDFSVDGVTTGSVNLASGVFTVTTGSSNNLEVSLSTSGDNGTVTVDLRDSVNLTGALTASAVSASGRVDAGTLDVAGTSTLHGDVTVTGQVSASTNVKAGGTLQVAGTTTLNGATTVNNDLTVNGNLFVSGAVTTVSSENMLVKDALLVLASGNLAATTDQGFVFTRGDDGNKAFIWEEGADEFALVNTTSTGAEADVAITSYADLHIDDLTADSGSFGGKLTVTGQMSGSSDLLVGGATTLGGALTVNNNVSSSGNLEVGGTSTFAGAMTVNGAATLTNGLTVTGAVNLPNGAISNAELENSSVTVTAGTGLLGGGNVALGGTVTLSASYGSTAGTAVEGNKALQLSGTANEIEVKVNGAAAGDGSITLGSGGALQIGLPDNVTVTSNLTVGANLAVTGNLSVNGNTTLGDSTSDQITVTGKFRITTLTSADSTVLTEYATSASNFAGHMFYLSGASGVAGFDQSNKWYFNENGVWHPSSFYIEMP